MVYLGLAFSLAIYLVLGLVALTLVVASGATVFVLARRFVNRVRLTKD